MDELDESQPQKLANAMAHLLEIIDDGLAFEEVRLPERPIRAARDLLRHGLIEVNGIGEVNLHRPSEYMAEPWFRAIYTGVEEWYRDQYDADALSARGNPPLQGLVIVRGAPFLLEVPQHRSEIEVEGKTAWMYFEAGIGPGEAPRSWLIHGPKFDRLSDEQAAAADIELQSVATALRTIQHHSLGIGPDETQRGLRASIRSYSEGAARRILSQTAEEFAFAWMELQMTAEAALKLVIFRATGEHPHKHELVSDLLSHPAASKVEFDRERLADWPAFKKISNRRYGKDYISGLIELYEAYRLVLDLAVACIRTVPQALPSGAGILLHVAPWLINDPMLPSSRRATEGS